MDCWAWNANDLHEHISMEPTRVWLQRLNPIIGDTFVTTLRNPILSEELPRQHVGRNDEYPQGTAAANIRVISYLHEHCGTRRWAKPKYKTNTLPTF